jgi:hypothetical protein
MTTGRPWGRPSGRGARAVRGTGPCVAPGGRSRPRPREARLRLRKAEPREVLRARIVLAAAQGGENKQMAAVPLSRISVADVREEAIACGLVEQLSVSTVWRWLDEDALKPWRHRSWIFPRARTSPPRRGACSTCTSTGLRASGWGQTSSPSRPTRRPRSRPAAAATRPGRQPTPRPCGSSTSTSAPFGRLVEQVMASEPMPRPRGCSGWSKTAAPIGARHRSNRPKKVHRITDDFKWS